MILGILVVIIFSLILLALLINFNFMDQTKTKTTAGDFFIYFGVLIGLYVSTFAFINLTFSLINKWLPDVNNYYSYFSTESMRMGIAVLIIFFPAFIYLSRLSSKALIVSPEKKDLWVRRWFYFLTLFLTGLAIAIDLSTLVYRFIGGEDLTMRFVLKVLVVLLVALAIFRFYLYELRRDVTMPTPNRKYMSYATGLIVLAIIVIGIVNIGSPTNQRNIRFDEQRRSDLSSIQYAITDYYRANGNKLPNDLTILAQGTTYYVSNIKDPVTMANYEYRIISQNKYELCAIFATDSKAELGKPYYPESGNWTHGIGRTCFERVAGEFSTKI